MSRLFWCLALHRTGQVAPELAETAVAFATTGSIGQTAERIPHESQITTRSHRVGYNRIMEERVLMANTKDTELAGARKGGRARKWATTRVSTYLQSYLKKRSLSLSKKWTAILFDSNLQLDSRARADQGVVISTGFQTKKHDPNYHCS